MKSVQFGKFSECLTIRLQASGRLSLTSRGEFVRQNESQLGSCMTCDDMFGAAAPAQRDKCLDELCYDDGFES